MGELTLNPGDGNVLYLELGGYMLYIFAKIFQTLLIKSAHFTICKLYLINLLIVGSWKKNNWTRTLLAWSNQTIQIHTGKKCQPPCWYVVLGCMCWASSHIEMAKHAYRVPERENPSFPRSFLPYREAVHGNG